MTTNSYETRREEIEHYFDRTAAEAWSKLTSDAPVSRIRATVRAGREQMRQTLLDWLPADMRGLRLLDAGCGTGALAIEAARKGAEVVAVDLSPKLVELARERMPADIGPGRVDFRAGDTFDPALGDFDHVVAMDSLIHYEVKDMLEVIRHLAPRIRGSFLFTFAPKTPLLAMMHAVGQFFPRGDRSPAIVPVRAARLQRLIAGAEDLAAWRVGRTQRIDSGFYTSQALELQHL